MCVLLADTRKVFQSKDVGLVSDFGLVWAKLGKDAGKSWKAENPKEKRLESEFSHGN